MTPRQFELLTFVRTYIAGHGYSPSYDEMAGAIGLASKSGIHRLITALAERGHIRRLPNRRRSIQVLAHPTPPPALGEASINV
jgi:repressor LexA